MILIYTVCKNKKEAMTVNDSGNMMASNSFLIMGIILVLVFMIYRRNQNKEQQKK